MHDLRVNGERLPGGWKRMRVPGDKSISQRMLVIGAAAPGRCEIAGLNRGRAVELLLPALRQLGCKVTPTVDGVTIERPLELCADSPRLDLGPSSGAARFLLGLLAGLEHGAVIDGDDVLRTRPMQWVVDPLRALGARIDYLGREGCLPVAVRPARIHSGRVEIPIGSAQAKTAVLLAAYTARVSVEINQPIPSRDHTERLLGSLGARVQNRSGKIRFQPGGTSALPAFRVPGDPSAAAYLVLAHLLGQNPGALFISDVGLNQTRTGFFSVLRESGAELELREDSLWHGEPVGSVLVRNTDRARLRAFLVEDDARLHSLIDEVPLLAALAAFARGRSEIRRAQELVFKETNRLETSRDLLRAFGGEAEVVGSTLVVPGRQSLRAAAVPCFGDHRIAMTATVIAATCAGQSRIVDGSCHETSFPEFVGSMRDLGIDVTATGEAVNFAAPAPLVGKHSL